MLAEHTEITAPTLWSRIIRKNVPAMVAVSGVHYFPNRHGELNVNIPLPEHKGMLLEFELCEKLFPQVEEYHSPGIPFPKEPAFPVFALASPIYIWIGEEGDPRDQRVWAKTICWEQEENLRRMQQLKLIQPKAMLMVDFDCPNTRGNLARISEILQRDKTSSRWLLSTDNGFHLIDEELFEPIEYPLRIGKLINEFADTAPENRRHIIQAFGNSLMSNCLNTKGLQRWITDILKTFKHYDDTGSDGIPYMIDIRHIAHSVDDYLRFMATKKGGFGFLRISGRKPNGSLPFVVARQIRGSFKLLGTLKNHPTQPNLL